MVLRLWQEWQRLWRLSRSVNSAQSPRWSRMWSTSVAGVRIPWRAHSRQKGSRSSCPGRRSSVQMGRLYQPCHWADWRRSACLGLCWAQYPSLVSTPQPGYRQGLDGFRATGYHLRANKKRPSHDSRSGGHRLRRLSDLDVGSGSGRYSRWIPARTACSTPAGLWPLCPVSDGELSACRRSGTSASHLSLLVYHIRHGFATLFPLFSTPFPFVIHACKHNKYKDYPVFLRCCSARYRQGVRSSSGSVDTSRGTR